jgi:glyoxylase-like metal-dependent hydrolase (beta-lactamase superfamily II)
MILSKTGKIDDDFYVLGHPAIPIYLMDGPNPIIFDAGFTILSGQYISEIETVLGSRTPAYCCITHVHFDHCGSIYYLKKRFPHMKIAASEKAKEILIRPNAIDLIRYLNAAAGSLVRQLGIQYDPELSFKPFRIDVVLKEGDHLEIAPGCHVEILETPGHTWDCLSFHIPERNILLTSEAAGQPDRNGHIVTDCLADFNQYKNSLLRLKSFKIDLLCPGHIFVFKNREVASYMERSFQACMEFRKAVEQCSVEEGGDIERIKARIKTFEYDPNPGPKQPEPAYLINLEARIKSVLNAQP